MGYTVDLAPAARRELQRLPTSVVQRVIAALRGLQNNARPHDSVKLEGSETTYRIRVGPYRVIYEVDEHARSVLITRIRHRKDAYQ